ncbi:hypothetical protein GS415_06600 [Rhodococcus hoagii]|nr:hypothetical protein [Prescottella equi]
MLRRHPRNHREGPAANTLPPGDYTKYVAGMFDDNPMGAPAGTNLTNLSLVATQGAKLGR